MDRIPSIELAMKNEKSEMEYYQRQADRSTNEVVKKLFETLAGDEREHMHRIRHLHEKLTAEGAWPADLPIKVDGTNIRVVLDNLPRNRHFSVQHDAADLDAIRTAVEFEENGIKFYSDLAQACTNAQERAFFEFLAEMEREHFLSIKDSIFFLEDPEGWFETKERVLLD